MNFVQAVQILTDAGVEFAIIGGWSAIMHGSAHLTNDLELCYSRTYANLQSLARALAPYHPRPAGFPPGPPFVWDERTLQGGTVFTLDTDLGRIDLLAEVAGLGDWAEVRKCCMRVPAFDREVCTLDLPSLIRAKRAAGRPKDLLVLPELESLLDAARDSQRVSGENKCEA
jgi:hypothetical protein